jgi:translin
MDGLSASVKYMLEYLKSIEERRERIIKGSRDVLLLCSKAIVNIHMKNMGEASEKIEKAKMLIDELRVVAGEDLRSYIVQIETEWVEASTLYFILNNNKIPSLEDLKVDVRSYILGLLDCIGELKRQVYDRVREGDSDNALRIFEVMDDLYSSLLQFAMYDNIIHNVRKKVDIARILLEDVRAMITEEARRMAIIESIDSIKTKMS